MHEKECYESYDHGGCRNVSSIARITVNWRLTKSFQAELAARVSILRHIII